MPAADSEAAGLDDQALLAAMDLDDSFVPVRTLAEGDGGTTELVVRREPRPGEPVLLVRKRMPAPLANESAWRALQVAELAGAGTAAGEPAMAPAAEAAGVSRLPHVRELYRLPDALVAVYDYVEGPTLRELVRERGPLAPGCAVALARQLCQALAPLHAAGVVHRDIAPATWGLLACAWTAPRTIPRALARGALRRRSSMGLHRQTQGRMFFRLAACWRTRSRRRTRQTLRSTLRHRSLRLCRRPCAR